MSIKKVVLDTNIIISATISAQGNPFKIMELVSDNKLQVYYNDEILAEYRKVLAYERLKIDPKKQVEIVDIIKENGIYIKSESSNIPLPDENDRIFYDTAKASEIILITGNKKHFPDESFIITPADFVRLLNDN